MSKEDELAEIDPGVPAPAESADANDAAQRYVAGTGAALTDCGHHGPSRETAAIAESAALVDRWETSDSTTRRYLLDGVGRQMMSAHEAPPPELQEQTMEPGYLGRYSDADFRIDINRDVLSADPKDGLDTYLHEYRHAEQAYEIQKSHGSMASPEAAQRASALEASSGDKYIKPEDDQAAYEQQLVEADANQFAAKTTAEIMKQRDALRAGRRPQES